MKQLQENGLVLKVVDELQNHLSFEIRFSQGKKKARLGLAYLFESLKEKWLSKLRGCKVINLMYNKSFNC